MRPTSLFLASTALSLGLFALAAPEPEWSDTPGRDEVLRALEEQAIASGCLLGTYERPDGSVKDDATERETSFVAPLASA
jgi:hypothetical protein